MRPSARPPPPHRARARRRSSGPASCTRGSSGKRSSRKADRSTQADTGGLELVLSRLDAGVYGFEFFAHENSLSITGRLVLHFRGPGLNRGPLFPPIEGAGGPNPK